MSDSSLFEDFLRGLSEGFSQVPTAVAGSMELMEKYPLAPAQWIEMKAAEKLAEKFRERGDEGLAKRFEYGSDAWNKMQGRAKSLSKNISELGPGGEAQGLPGKIAEGFGAVPGTIAGLTPYFATLGAIPVAGPALAMGGHSASMAAADDRASDKDIARAAAAGGVEGALFGGVGSIAAPIKSAGKRMLAQGAGSAAIGGGSAAYHGGGVEDVIAQGTVLGLLGAHHARRVDPRAIEKAREKRKTGDKDIDAVREQIAPLDAPTEFSWTDSATKAYETIVYGRAGHDRALREIGAKNPDLADTIKIVQGYAEGNSKIGAMASADVLSGLRDPRQIDKVLAEGPGAAFGRLGFKKGDWPKLEAFLLSQRNTELRTKKKKITQDEVDAISGKKIEMEYEVPYDPGGNPAAEAAVIGRYGQDPRYKEFGEVFNKWGEAHIDMLSSGGKGNRVLAPKQAEKMKASKSWVPLLRVLGEELDTLVANDKGFIRRTDPIYGLKGGKGQVHDVLYGATRFSAHVLDEMTHSRWMGGLMNLLEKSPEHNHLVKNLGRERGFEKQQYGELLERAKAKMGDDVTDMGEMLQFWSPRTRFNKADNTIEFWQDGTKKFYELDPKLFRSVAGQQNARLHPFFDFLFGKPKRAMVLGYTGLNAGFSLALNPIRDTLQAGITSKDPNLWRVIKRAKKGLMDEIHKTEEFKQFEAAGGTMFGLVGQEPKTFKYMQEQIFQSGRGKAGHVELFRKHPVQYYRDVLSKLENINRLGEFSLEKLKHGNSERGTLGGLMESADVTINFARLGTLGRIANQMIPFFNAQVQGLDKFARTFAGEDYYLKGKDRPGGAGAKQAMKMAMPSLTSAAMTMSAPALALWWFQKDEPWYREMPMYEKMMYLPFGPRLKIPVPFEFGMVFGTLPAALADSIYQNDPEIFADAGRQSLDVFLPDIWPAAVSPPMELKANEDFFRNTPIETMSEERLMPQDRYRRNTSELYKGMADAASGMPSVLGHDIEALRSPLQLQHLAERYSGGLSRAVSNPLRPVKEAADFPVIGRLATRQQRYGASVDKFFKEIKEMEQIRGSYQKSISRGDYDRAREIMQKHGDKIKLLKTYRKYQKIISAMSRSGADPREITKIARQALDLR